MRLFIWKNEKYNSEAGYNHYIVDDGYDIFYTFYGNIYHNLKDVKILGRKYLGYNLRDIEELDFEEWEIFPVQEKDFNNLKSLIPLEYFL